MIWQQQTVADADAMREDAALFSGSSFCCAYATVMATALAAMDADVATTTVSGPFCYFSAVVDVETTSANQRY